MSLLRWGSSSANKNGLSPSCSGSGVSRISTRVQAADGGAGDAASDAGSSLFTDTPACAPPGGRTALVKVEGDVGEFRFAYEATVASDLIAGSLDTLDFGGTTQLRYVNLSWQGGLRPGEIHALKGDHLAIPDSFTGGAGPYCIVAGEIASAPDSQKPAMGALIHFRVSKVQKRTARDASGVCEGPELDADLRGCLFRTNPYLPPN